MIRLYKLDASSAVKIIEGHTSGLKDVDVSPPDGQTIASTGSDGTVRIWDSQTYRLLHTLKTKASVRDVDYMDSNWLVAATYENTVQFWQIKQQAAQKMTSRLVHTISKTAGKVKSVAFNAQKNQLAITQSNHIQLWALKFEDSQIKVEPLLEKLLKGHRKPVNAISFSPNGKFLASGSADHTAILWYWDTKTSKVLTGHDSWINNVGFSQDSKYLATASSDHTIKLWRVADGQLLTTTQKQDRHKDWVWDVSFAPNKSLNKNHYILVSGGADNVIKLWHYYPEKQIKLVRSLRGHEGWVRSVGFSNDGDYIVSASADQTIRFWELKHFGQQNIESNVKKLLKTGCNLLSNYLANNAKLKESDKEICQ